MDLSELDLFVDAISMYLKLNLPFTILHDKNSLTWQPAYKVGVERDFESIQIFTNYLLKNVGSLDYKALPEEHFYKIRVLVELLEKVVEDRKKKAPKGLYKETRQKILALRLGGKIQYEEIKTIDRELYAFIKANQLEIKFFGLGIQLNEKLAIPFEGNLQVPWKDMTKVLLTDRSGRDYGYRFFYDDRLVMETDLKFLMTEEFSVLGDGIGFYHPLRSLPMKPMAIRDPDEWGRKNRIEIVLQKSKSTFYLLLRREDGAIYCIGLDKGKIAAPVSSYFVTHKCKYEFEMTSREFEAFFMKLEIDRHYKKGYTEKKMLEILQETFGLEPIPKKRTTKFKWIKKWLQKVVELRKGKGTC